MGGRSKDLGYLLDRARKQGCTVTLRNNGHYKIDTPHGPYYCSRTPSDWRVLMKIRKDLAKRGVDA
jgi:hypothetical protein